jgi:hypothetical protein
VCVGYNSPQEQIECAVESLLAQSHSDLSVAVAYGPATARRRDPLRNVGDPRLIRIRAGSAPMRGAVFAVAAACGRLDGSLLLVHGADDRSDPDRVAILLEALREEHAVAALSALRVVTTVEGVERHSALIRLRALSSSLTPELREHGPCCGLFTRYAIERIGGQWVGVHPGWDRLFLHFLLMTGHVAYVDEPLYTRTHEACSVPTARGIMASAESRRLAAIELATLYATAFREYLDYLAGVRSEDELADSLREHISPAPSVRRSDIRRPAA